MTVPIDRPLRRSPDAAFQQLSDDRAVILHVETGDYYAVNAVGGAIWSEIDGTTIADVVEAMRDRFPDAPPTLADDVQGFVDGLLERGLVTLD